MRQPAVYLLASQRNGTLYVGVTSDLIKRIWQHRTHAVEGFTEKYHVNQLVWFEQHETMESAIAREKAIKKWNRKWKLALIEKSNPSWIDLWPVITGEVSDFSSPLDSRLRGNDESGAPGRCLPPPAISSPSVFPARAGTAPAVTPTRAEAAPTVIPAKAGIQKGGNA